MGKRCPCSAKHCPLPLPLTDIKVTEIIRSRPVPSRSSISLDLCSGLWDQG